MPCTLLIFLIVAAAALTVDAEFRIRTKRGSYATPGSYNLGGGTYPTPGSGSYNNGGLYPPPNSYTRGGVSGGYIGRNNGYPTSGSYNGDSWRGFEGNNGGGSGGWGDSFGGLGGPGPVIGGSGSRTAGPPGFR